MKKILLTLFIIICVFLCACAHFEKEEQEKILTDNRYDAFNEFNEFVETNPYDKEFNKALDVGAVSIEDALKDYMNNWQEELNYTVIIAKSLFDSATEYSSWKNSMDANLEAVNCLYKTQYNTALTAKVGQIQFCEIKLTHIRAVKSLTLNAKYYCFILEKEKGVAKEEMISISWNQK